MSAHDGDSTRVPAGWYGDPLARGQERYWDGGAWTNDVRRAQLAALPDLAARPVAATPPATGGATAAPRPADGTPYAAPPQQWGTPPQQWGAAAPQPWQQQWPGQAQGTGAATNGRSATLATFGRRLGATAIDAVITIVLTALVTSPVLVAFLRRTWDFTLANPNATLQEQMAASQTLLPTTDALLLLLGSVAVSLVYGTVLLAWRGATVGQAALRLRVVPRGELEHTGGIGVGRALARSLVWSLAGQWMTEPFLAVVLLFCAVPILTSADRQGLHDRLAGTQVVLRPLAVPTR